MRLNLYVIVNDMARAVDFYRQVFEREPVMQSERYSMFALDGGGLYGLFNRADYPSPVQAGNNVTPNLLVGDVNREYERLKGLPSPFRSELIQNGPYRLFVMADPDGNGIEFYSES